MLLLAFCIAVIFAFFGFWFFLIGFIIMGAYYFIINPRLIKADEELMAKGEEPRWHRRKYYQR